jgi:hypothetical protein
MVHDTPARRKARELKAKARKLEQEAAILAGIRETEELGAIKANRAKELKTAAKDLNQSARLEDITVRRNPLSKPTRKGDRIYYRWVCSWQEGDRTVSKYLGSCKKMSEAEALRKARKLKAEALGIDVPGPISFSKAFTF